MLPEESRSTLALGPLALICTPLSTVVAVVELEPMRMAPAVAMLLAPVSIVPGPLTLRASAEAGAMVMPPPAPEPVAWVVSLDLLLRLSEWVSTAMEPPAPVLLVSATAAAPSLRVMEMAEKLIWPPLPVQVAWVVARV